MPPPYRTPPPLTLAGACKGEPVSLSHHPTAAQFPSGGVNTGSQAAPDFNSYDLSAHQNITFHTMSFYHHHHHFSFPAEGHDAMRFQLNLNQV